MLTRMRGSTRKDIPKHMLLKQLSKQRRKKMDQSLSSARYMGTDM